MGSCKELGLYKTKISTQLRNSEVIKVMLLGKNYATDIEGTGKDIYDVLDEQIFSHLFVDGTVTETKSYIFYDIRIPRFSTNIKNVEMFIYAISHREILDDLDDLSLDIRRNYYGNRTDKLAQAVEELFCENEDTARDFGIGEISLTDVSIFNTSDFYGRILTFNIPNFR